MARTLAALVVMVAIALAATGCGRKGTLEKPEGSDFPRQYPSE